MKAHRPSAGPSTIGRIGRKAAARRAACPASSYPGARGVGQHRQETTPETSQGGEQGTRSRSRTGGPAGDRLAVVGQLDSKNRFSLPKAVRDAIHVGPGDSVFLNVDDEHGDVPTVRVVKAVNPLATMLDALAAEALREYHAGETISLRDLMDELGIDPATVRDTDDGPEPGKSTPD